MRRLAKAGSFDNACLGFNACCVITCSIPISKALWTDWFSSASHEASVGKMSYGLAYEPKDTPDRLSLFFLFRFIPFSAPVDAIDVLRMCRAWVAKQA